MVHITVTWIPFESTNDILSFNLYMKEEELDKEIWTNIKSVLIKNNKYQESSNYTISDVLIKYENYGKDPIYDTLFIGIPNNTKISTLQFKDKNNIYINVFESNIENSCYHFIDNIKEEEPQDEKVCIIQ